MIHQDLHVKQLINAEIIELRNAGFEKELISTLEDRSKAYLDNDDYDTLVYLYDDNQIYHILYDMDIFYRLNLHRQCGMLTT